MECARNTSEGAIKERGRKKLADLDMRKMVVGLQERHRLHRAKMNGVCLS